MNWLFNTLWTLLTSPGVEATATLIGLVPIAYAATKYLVVPLRFYLDERKVEVLNAERRCLRQVASEMNQLDRATYWEDLLYTPLESS